MFSKEKAAYAIMFSMDNFGQWLLDVISEKGIAQNELARMAGISRGTLSNIISGARGRGPGSLKAIARALRLPPELVFREAGLLPHDPESDEFEKELIHLYNELDDSNREDVLDYTRLRLRKQEQEESRKRERTRVT